MSADEALLELLRLLKAADYRFTAVSPATHARVLARPCPRPGLRDIFGWNRPFEEDDLDRPFLECLRESEMVDDQAGKLRSRIRVARLGNILFVHSSFPTDDRNSVFFGPDTYRFVRAVRAHLEGEASQWIVDMGAGCGAGAIAAAALTPEARVSAVDVNPLALRFAAINAQAAGVEIETVEARQIPEGADLVIANPPYIMDDARRAYRDGGGLYGGEVALHWARLVEGLTASNPNLQGFQRKGGKVIFYHGWKDQNIAPLHTVDYYNEVVSTLGGVSTYAAALKKTQTFARLFMVPGMQHCNGGPGPNTFDVLGALQQWVEHGVAPDSIIASHSTAGVVDRTRPLCPYPKVARWTGSGSTDVAANFTCKDPT